MRATTCTRATSYTWMDAFEMIVMMAVVAGHKCVVENMLTVYM